MNRLSIAAFFLLFSFALNSGSDAKEIKFETADGKFKVTGTVGYYVANGKPVESPVGDETGLAVVIIRPDGKPTNPVPVKLLSGITKRKLFSRTSESEHEIIRLHFRSDSWKSHVSEVRTSEETRYPLDRYKIDAGRMCLRADNNRGCQINIKEVFSEIYSVKMKVALLRGAMEFTIGPVRGILNWRGKPNGEYNKSLFQPLLPSPAPTGYRWDHNKRPKIVTRGAPLTYSKIHEIEVYCDDGNGKQVTVAVDGQRVADGLVPGDTLVGTVHLFGNLDIESIEVVGKVDPIKTFNGWWSHY